MSPEGCAAGSYSVRVITVGIIEGTRSDNKRRLLNTCHVDRGDRLTQGYCNKCVHAYKSRDIIYIYIHIPYEFYR